MSEQRHIIVHYHIFKNAGSTVVSTLARNFGPLFASWDGDEFNTQISGAELLDFLYEHRSVLALTSHHLRPPKPSAAGFVFHDVLLLRHPLDRLRSMYDFYRSALPTDDPLTHEAKRRTAREFFELLINDYPHLVTSSQVNYVANQGSKVPDLDDAERACGMIRDAAVPGVTDEFDRCMLAAEYHLRQFFPGLDLSHISENVTRGRRQTLQQRLQEFEKQCGQKIYRALFELNQFDFQLVHSARGEALARFGRVPGCDAALEEFKMRTKALKARARLLPPPIDHPRDFSFYAGGMDQE